VLKHEQKQTEAAVLNFKQALALGQSLADEILAICNNNIGELLAEGGELDTALLYVEEGLKMRNLLDNEVEIADSYLNMAHIYAMQKKYSEASNYLSLAEKIANTYDYLQAKVLLYKYRAELYSGQGDYQKAYGFLQQEYALKDSLQNIEKGNLIFPVSSPGSPGTEGDAKKPFHNAWLMTGCLLLAAAIPVILIRYKR
jgi:tetratricopeptide (TPR) repeat protein